jgi:putative ABC transport system permease protein
LAGADGGSVTNVRAADYVEEVLWSFRKQKLRTALTATGIGIGAFAIALMVGLGQGLQSYIEGQIRAFGNPRVVMVFPEAAKMGEKFLDQLTKIGKPAEKLQQEDEAEKRIRRGGLWITPEQVQDLRAIPGVASVAPFTWLETDGVALVDLQTHEPGDFYKVDFSTLTTNPLVGAPSAGALPGLEEDAKVVLSPQYTQSFGLDPARLLGREVVVRIPKLAGITDRFLFRDPARFKDEHETFRATIVGLAEESPMSRVVYASVPLGRAMARYQAQNPDLLSENKIGVQAHVRIADDADPARVKAEIKKVGLVARSMEEQLRDVSRTFLVIKSFLALFGVIALMVATFGIVNTLLMAISERTREIGVMKALGATESTIRRMFATEAAAIGVVGGAGGSAVACLVGVAANAAARRLPVAESLQGYSVFVFPWWLVLGAVAFATVVGALAGLYPANRAAALDPIEALRYE